MFCKRNVFEYIKGYKARGECGAMLYRVDAKWCKRDSYVSDFVFMHCRDIVELMRRGCWEGEV